MIEPLSFVAPPRPVSTPAWVFAATVTVCMAVFAVDLAMPLGVAGGVPYVGAVLLGLWARRKRFTAITASVCALLTIAGYVLSPPGGENWVVVTNRLLTLLVIWITAAGVMTHRRMDALLRAEERALRDVKHALDQASIVAITDPRGAITYVNDKFCEISGYRREELLGRDHRILNSGRHDKDVFQSLWKTIRTGEVWRGEICNRTKTGEFYWVDTTIIPFMDEEGDPVQYLAIRTDITARKQAEEQLREQATLARLGKMAAVVAHEVKNPLAGIAGAVQVLRGRVAPGGMEHKVMGDILDRIDLLNQTIQDLLLYARPREPQFAPVDLAGLLQNTTAVLADDPALGGVEILLPETTPVVLGDAGLLQQALLNLMLNAAQAMQGKGTLRIEAEYGEKSCRLGIHDSGPGIPEEIRGRLFEPFFTTRPKGTGLGLAIVKRIIDQHQGSIEILPGAAGGTSVLIRLPASNAA